MPALAVNHVLSGEELLNLGDVGPCELVDGRIVPSSPTGCEHGTIEGNIVYLFNSYTRLVPWDGSWLVK